MFHSHLFTQKAKWFVGNFQPYGEDDVTRRPGLIRFPPAFLSFSKTDPVESSHVRAIPVTDLLRGILQGTEIFIVLLENLERLAGAFLSFWVTFAVRVLPGDTKNDYLLGWFSAVRHLFGKMNGSWKKQCSAGLQRGQLTAQMLTVLFPVGQVASRETMCSMWKHFMGLITSSLKGAWRVRDPPRGNPLDYSKSSLTRGMCSKNYPR